MVRDYDSSEVPSVHNLQEAPTVRDEPGFRQVVFRGMDLLIGFTEIGPEREDNPPHSHPWEQMNMLIDGELDFLVAGEQVSMEKYDAVSIPPNVEHTSRAVSDEPATLLAFWPLREDRLDATAYQTEFGSQ